MQQPIAILYEHPEWFKPLFAELERRRVPHVALHAIDHVYDPDERHSPFRLVVNRMSPSAWMRGNCDTIFHSLRYLEHLDDIGTARSTGRPPSATSYPRPPSTRSWRGSGCAIPPPAC